MSLAETLKEESLTATAQPAADALAAWRNRARAQLAELPFPERKTERWKYTSLQPLTEGHLASLASGEAGEFALPHFSDVVLQIHNGKPGDIPALPEGVTAELFSTAAPEEVHEPDAFTAFNGAALHDGVRIRVAKNARIAEPLHLVISSASTTAASAPSRVEVVVESGAQLSIIEHYVGHGPVLASAVTRIVAGENSQLTHYRLQDEDSESLHVGRVELDVQAHARIRSYHLMQGNRLRRNEVQGRLLGQGAELDLRGVFLGFDRTHIDNQISVDHCVPHCQSSQIYRGIVGDRAKGVFNGRIHIHHGASGTDAWLSNANLLLSRDAEIDTKPELEIYNDDVKCAHGTTVGQLDPHQLFYLQSRGIPERAAKRMLAVGFVNTLVMDMPHEAVAEWATAWLGKVL